MACAALQAYLSVVNQVETKEFQSDVLPLSVPREQVLPDERPLAHFTFVVHFCAVIQLVSSVFRKIPSELVPICSYKFFFFFFFFSFLVVSSISVNGNLYRKCSALVKTYKKIQKIIFLNNL